jgi:hypothetical protein
MRDQLLAYAAVHMAAFGPSRHFAAAQQFGAFGEKRTLGPDL